MELELAFAIKLQQGRQILEELARKENIEAIACGVVKGLKPHLPQIRERLQRVKQEQVNG